ncbi:hypothetical protein V1512DRAFT_266561 [Lipomyces arxii]|uniref:uncharacterized protein n=1 Tax=Lipomyces arxii TaxID=56418 RepID=UPI0034CF0265
MPNTKVGMYDVDDSSAKDISSFPYLNPNEFSVACSAFLPRLHQSQLQAKLIYNESKIIVGIELVTWKVCDRAEITTVAHILLSPVYLLPTLYFTCTSTNDNGEYHPITLVSEVYEATSMTENIKSMMKAPSMLQFSSSGTISQCQHPLHDTVCFYVHPCHTGDVMSTINEDPEADSIGLDSYLAIWIGIVGGAVGITLKG